MKELKKGNMVKLDIEGNVTYGIILSIVDGIASVNYKDPLSREREYITRPFELSTLIKTGTP